MVVFLVVLEYFVQVGLFFFGDLKLDLPVVEPFDH